MKRGRLLVGALAVLVLGSCAGNTPQIMQVFWQRNFRFDPVTGAITDEMSLYLHVNDDDGFDDLESIFLIADEAELFWEITNDSWAMDDRQGEIWIGSNRLHVSGGTSFPTGDYRVLLIDKAGERSRAEIFVPPLNMEIDSSRFPRLSLNAAQARIGNGNGQRHILWFYNASGDLVKSYATAETNVQLDAVLSSRELGSVTEVYIYRLEAALGVGLISGPFALNG